MSTPVCRVDLYGARGNATMQWVPERQTPYGLAPSGDLLVCTTQKRLGAQHPYGVFELHLTCQRDRAGLQWSDKIVPNDVVVIQMMNHHGTTGPDGAGEMHTVMVGLVDTVTQAHGMVGGRPQRHIKVQGRDFGKVLTEGTVTYWTFVAATLLGAQQFIDPSRFIGTPSSVLRALLEEIFTRFMKMTVQHHGGPRSIWDCFGYKLRSYGTELPKGLSEQFLTAQGPFWTFVRQVASHPFHEVFVDTRRIQDTILQDDELPDDMEYRTPVATFGVDRSAPMLFMRPTPFPYFSDRPVALAASASELADGTVPVGEVLVGVLHRDDWDALIRHEIGTDDPMRGQPISETLSTSDREALSLYTVIPQDEVIGEQMWRLQASVIVDPRRFARYGYRPATPTTSLVKPFHDSSSMLAFYESLMRRLAWWNVLNDQFVSGQKVCTLSPHLHIGDRLLDRSHATGRAHEFYIESVSHRIVFGEQASTTVGVTRGLPVDDYARLDDLMSQEVLQLIPPTSVAKTFVEMTDKAQRMP